MLVMRSHALLVASSIALLIAACGGSSGSADGGPDSASDAPPAGDAGDGGDVPCTASSEAIIPTMSDELVTMLEVAGDEVLFVRRSTLGSPTVLEKIRRDGTGRAVLHTSAGSRAILDVTVSGSNAIFLERNADVTPKAELFSIPIAGGVPTRIGTATWEPSTMRFFGADATAAYFVEDTRVHRVTLSSGADAVVSAPVGLGTFLQLTLSGDDLFWVASQKARRVAKAATMTTPTDLDGLTGQPDCTFPLAGFAVTPTKVACGFAGVTTFDRDGTLPMSIVPRAQGSQANVLVASADEQLYLLEPSDGTKDVRLKKVASSGGPVIPIACDVRAVANKTNGAGFPDATSWEVAVSPTDVVWIERRGASPTALSYSIRRAAR